MHNVILSIIVSIPMEEYCRFSFCCATVVGKHMIDIAAILPPLCEIVNI